MGATRGEVERRCRHCSTIFHSQEEDEAFCCNGCAFVHDLIHERGLEKFYEFKGVAASPPVQANFLQPRDDPWLETLATNLSGSDEPVSVLNFDIQGMSCVGCAWLIESIFNEQPGGLRLDIQIQLGRVRLQVKSGTFDLLQFARELRKFGYILGPAGADRSRGESDQLLTRVGVCGALAMNTMLFTLPGYLGMEADFAFARIFSLLALLFASLAFAVGGSYFIQRAWAGARRGIMHIDLPIALGVTAAYMGSLVGWAIGQERFIYFDFVSVFMFLMLIGRWMQEVVLERNRRQLLGINPHAERVERRQSPAGEAVGLVSIRSLLPGDVFEVPAGRVVPVSSRLRASHASISLEWISGEAEVRTVSFGDHLPSGATNLGSGTLLCEASESWSGSLLGRLVDSAPERIRYSGLERILKGYIGAVLVIALLGFASWGIVGASWVRACQVLVSVLVVSCPCALGVALPLANEMATVRLRVKGLFVRNDTLWTRLKGLRQIVFDKTGTLTLENPVLANAEALTALTLEDKRALGALVGDSLHPVSRSLREQLLREPVWREATSKATPMEVPGQGVRIQLNGHEWRLGRPEWAADADRVVGSDTVLSRDGEVRAAFRFNESARPGAKADLRYLQRSGRSLFILSGDRREKVASMLAALDLPAQSGLGELTPDEKAEWLRAHNPGETLFIGDGANDSLAFNVAACTGTPVAESPLLREKADFFFLGRSLGAIGALFRIGAERRRATKAVFVFSLTYNGVVVVLSLLGHMHPLLAAVLMPISSFATLALVRLSFLGRSRSRAAPRWFSPPMAVGAHRQKSPPQTGRARRR